MPDGTHPTRMSVYYPFSLYKESPPKINPARMLFKYPQISERAEDVMNKWINDYERIRPTLALYFAVASEKYTYQDAKFLALAQALEAYHRRTVDGTELIFRERIKGLIEPFEELIGNSDERAKLVRAIKKTRNYFTHYDEKNKSVAKTDPKSLLLLSQKIVAILQLQLLRFLGFTHEEIVAIAEDSTRSLYYKLRS